MRGAREFAKLFGKSQQIGRLYFEVGKHARGTTFKIYVLPEGIKATRQKIAANNDIIEVFGMTRGDLGWTEEYGWIYTGPWQKTFSDIIVKKRIDSAKQIELDKIEAAKAKNMADLKIEIMRGEWSDE